MPSSTPPAAGRVRFERDAGDARIGRITLVHERRLNAISAAMWRELRSLAAALDAMAPALHAVIVRGDGGNFAAGADIAEFPELRCTTAGLRDYHEATVAPALQALRASDVPLVAQIEGVCVGGGLEIAACCDLRIGAPDVRLGAPIARLGFPMAPDEMALLVEAFGRAAVAELLLEAGLLDAAGALRRGLLHRIADDTAGAATASAQRIAAGSVAVARANKRGLRQCSRGGANAAERTAHFSYAAAADHREGIAAFLAGREPHFGNELP